MSDLPTKPGPYYWREKDEDEWELVIVIYHNDPFMEPTVKCVLNDFENDLKAMDGQWLRIPDADELVELQACKKMVDGLLRLVDDVYEWRQHIPGPEFCELRADIQALGDYVTILRKEKL